ncbi:MAG: Gfo/Idh/MocA family protein [Phycisphaerae bacterium]
MSNQKIKKGIDRRGFLRSTAAAGAGLALSPILLGQVAGRKKDDDINVALIGTGEQGRTLMMACLKVPGIRFKAVCDIWPYNLKYASKRLKAYRHQHNVYEDYKEMLDREKDLDAAIIATPDFWHAEQTISCLEAGLHVYCEKEMSNTLEAAKRMVKAAKRTGRLLQIGHQRRSNLRYILCCEKLLKEAKLLGKITAVNGQWNRGVSPARGWPKETGLDTTTLNKYGYESMAQLRNWRWYKGLGGGPIVDLGSHQIDVYNWFLDATPKAVIASGRTNYYDTNTHQWYDTVMAIYQYETSQGPVSAYYQTLTANSSDGYFEKFMGDQGTLKISESVERCAVYPESRDIDAATWLKCIQKNYLTAPEEIMEVINKLTLSQLARYLMVDETPPPVHRPRFKLPITMDKPVHQPHLENFFDAIRGKAKLNCPADIGYETAVTVLKVNEAVEAGRRLDFKPEEFTV